MTELSDQPISNSTSKIAEIANIISSKFIVIGFCLLAIILPLQTPLLIFLTNFLGLSQNTSQFLALWKELVVAVLMLFFASSIFLEFLQSRYKKKFLFRYRFAPLCIWLFLSFFVAFTSLVLSSTPLPVFVLGYRYELWWLGFFSLSFAYFGTNFYSNSNPNTLLSGNSSNNSYNNSSNFSQNPKLAVQIQKPLITSILVGFGFSCLFSIASLVLGVFYGQSYFLTQIGYGQGFFETIPACHYIDFGVDSCRLSGGFATPIHYAGYLLLVLPVLWQSISKTSLKLSLVGLNLLFILLSVSRFALVGLVVAASFIAFNWLWKIAQNILSNRYFEANKLTSLVTKTVANNAKKVAWVSLSLPFLVVFITTAVPDPGQLVGILPTEILKPSSTSEHRRQTLANVDLVLEYPNLLLKGVGLGYTGAGAEVGLVGEENAGENDSKTGNPLVDNYGYIADRWFIKRERIVVAENWFLQVLVSGGVFYLLGYIALVLVPVVGLYKIGIYKAGLQNDELLRDGKRVGKVAGNEVLESVASQNQGDVIVEKKGNFGAIKHLEASISQHLPWLCFYAIIGGNLMLGLWANQTIALYWTVCWLALSVVKNRNEE